MILQGVVAEVVAESLPYPSADIPTVRFVNISMLYLCLACGVAVDGYLDPIWGYFSRTKVKTERLSKINQVLMMGIPLCRRIFGGRDHLSTSLLIPAFVKTLLLMKPSL